MKTYLFACVHNAGRSQMAAAWLTALADPDKALAISAGTQPGARVHPEVVTTMREVGIELEGREPLLRTDEPAGSATMLIHQGCGEACPWVPGVRRDARPPTRPQGRSLDEVRAVRDEVRARMGALVAAELIGR